MDEPGKILNGGNSLRPQKRIFLGLLAVTCLLFTIILGGALVRALRGAHQPQSPIAPDPGGFLRRLLLLVVGGLVCWP